MSDAMLSVTEWTNFVIVSVEQHHRNVQSHHGKDVMKGRMP